MNRMVRRALVCCLLFWCFTGHALAQNDPQYVIMYDGHYLAHVNNGGTWELQDATTFSPNCLWFSSNNYNYYFNDGTSLRYLAAPLERDGALYLSDSYPGTQVLNNNLLDYFFYDWDHGLARGEQHPMDECLTIYNNTHLTQCWEVVWVSYENNQWQMSSDYGYDPTTYAAKFYPVTITEHPQVISTETGGVSDLTDLEMDYPSTESLSVTATNYTYTYTPAYTTYVFNNGTHNYYGGTDNGTSTPESTTSSDNTVSGYAWTITGEGAEYLTLTNANTATPTLAYNTTENTTGHKTATLTLTVTYSDGGTQVRTATVLVKTACQNPTQLATPVVDYEGVTVSWVNTSDRYKLYWKKQSDSEFNYVEVSGANTYTLTGLAPSYEGNPSVYEYKVAAFCNNVEITDPAPTVYSFTTAIDPHAVIYGAVFGGGRMANVTGNTNVVIINCDTLAAVYGGNDIAGVVEGVNGSTITLGVNADNTYAVNYNNSTASVKVNIGDVYGGGNGYYAYNGNTFQSATERTYTVASGASVTALSENGWDQPVWTNTGSDRVLTLPDICISTIVVTNDQVKIDSLFGGAKNAFMGEKAGGKGSNITVNGGTIFAVFGGNNVGGGQGYGWHNVTVNATKTTTASLTPNVASTATTGYGRDFGIRYLFGGGNKVYGSTTNVIINGGQCDTIFAGGNSADVYAANLTVDCAIAAGSGNNTFGKVYSSAISSYSSSIAINDSYDWDGTGVYNVHTLFGGNNQATMEGIPNITLSSGSVGTVYGGGNAGDMVAQATDNGSGGTLTINGDNVKYSTHVAMNNANMVVDYIYGGCQVSNVHYSTWVEIENGHVGTVFGGCNVSGDVGSTRLDLEADQWLNPEHTISNPDYQKVYGATYVVASGGTVYKNLFAGGNGYYHCVDANGYYVSGLNYADPEGHYIGLSTPTHNETHVVVNAGATIKGNVYAGGNLACVGFDNNAINHNSNHASFPRFVGLASVRMSGGTVNGNVFGGGNMANVYGSNEVQVSGGTIDKSLYGGNDRTGKVAQISNRVLPADYNMASDGQTSLLEPKVYTYLSLTGKPTITNVYGGGNGDYEYFSNFTDAQNYTGPKETVVTCDSENQPIQRCTFVDINIDGGDAGGHIGTVYGGGDGVTVNEFLKVFLNVKDNQIGYSNVETIFGGNNKGDLALVPDIILLKGQVNTVYGGCNQGAMTGGKNLTVGSNTYNNVGSYVRLLKEYDPDGAGSTYPAVSTNAKVVNAVYGGCRMNGVTSNSIVFVEGGNHEGVGIFGGSDISGTIGGTSRVVVDGANAVVGNVFGGGNGDYDYTSTYSGYNKPSSVTSRVDMLAGTATNLFAGGNACGSGTTEMQVEGGTVTTGIYGGSNTSGTITNATSVNVVSGTVNKVFGGGKGEDTGVNGNVTVNIGNTTGGPTVNGNVYGGSEKGIVNDASTDLTQVNILNGTLNAYVYGGGQGELGNSTKGKVNGQVEVNIGAYDSGTSTYSGSATFGNNSKVFGCNDAGGSPQDNVTVNIYSTGHNSTNSYPNPVPTDAEELVGATASQFAIQAVYGGGNLADYAPQNGNTSSTKETKVHVYQCDQNTIKDVFGGSNQASAQNTHVIIDGGRIDRTFGGGNGEVGPAPVVGTAKTEINAGLITQVFGGSNTNGNIGTIDLNIVPSAACPELILIYEIFSGSNQAPLYGDMITNLVGDCYDPANPKEPDGYNYYGGTNLAPVYGNVTMNVYGGYYVNLFGGSRGYVDTNDATNNISADIRRFPTQAEVNAHPDDYPQEMKDYLAAHNSAYGTGGNVTLNIYGGKIENAFGGSDVLGDIEGKITVNVLQGGGDQNIDHCPLDLTKVYGGGKETEYNPITAIVGASLLVPEVNILKGTVNEDVFGGGLGASATVTGNPVVTIGDVASGHESYVATVGDVSTRYGNVYGGGELAQVYGNTKIVIQKANTIIEGTVYGGGKGSTDNVDHGLVKGNTWVEMTNGHVRRSIYGGGELGSVGFFTAHYADGEDPLHVAGEPKTCQEGTGVTKVRVSGGMVGLNEARMPDPNDPPLDDDFGYIFCAGKGVSDSITYPLANLLAASDSSYLEISGTAVITGSIYGGSENGQVIRNTRVKIKGGQIGTGHYKDGSGHHWDDLYSESDWTDAINSIKNGTFTGTDVFHQCDAWPFKPEGQRYVYDHYAIYGPDADGNYYYDAGLTQSACGGSHSAGDGHSFYGNVFGGGSGYYPYAPGQWRRSAGRVCGNTLVEIVGGHILNNVYGGNEITDVIGHSKVVMKGGTLGVPRSLDSITARPVNSYLFGAGMGDPRTLFNGWSNVGSAEVVVDSVAVIFGSVFGGGEDGHVIANATTTIQGNTLIGTLGTSSVDGNVFGGGRGFSGNALTAGVVCGNVILNIGGNAKLLGSVFGGGRLAAVGTYLAEEGTSNYGKLQPGDTHGNITINITGGTIGNQHHLSHSNYSIGDVFGGSKGTWKYDVDRNQHLGLAKNTTVNISQASGNTTRIYGSVYGGGEIASVGAFTYADDAQVNSYNPTHPSEPLTVGDVYELAMDNTGIAKINITGGTIGQLNTKGHVFGSCLGKAGMHYSGYSFVDSTYVRLNGGTVYGSIFGGGENGHVLHNTNVKIEDGTVGIRIDTITHLTNSTIYRGNVYGGGRGIDEVTNSSKGSNPSATYSITAGKVSGNTNVTVSGGTIYRNVYGGGSFASVGDPDEEPANGVFTTGLATVTVSGGQIGTDGGRNANNYTPATPTRESRLENGFVFGSGRGVSGAEGSVYDSLAYVNNSIVNIQGTAYVTGSVFGGGENGHVKNHTLVNVNPGGSYISQTVDTGSFNAYPFISENKEPYPVIGYPLSRDDMVEDLEKPRIIYRGNVYGGGRGIDPYDDHGTLSENAGVVFGNTEVRITGGTIRHDVYGGGSVASVGTLTYDHAHNDSVMVIKTGTGNSHVFISGNAVIGIDSTLDIVKVMSGSTLLHNLAGINNGQVFGGGRGQSGDLFKNLAYVDSTRVEISENAVIYGAVFGGGCNGHVKRDTYVKMTGGTIGHSLSESEKNTSFLHPEPIYFGNVYGGGRGIDHTNLPGTISHTAGQVYGNTKVEISGGRVHNDVYGGGSLANVGVERYDAQGNVVGITSGGYAYVTITGNAIIGSDGKNAGFVYGSGRGMAGSTWSDMAYVDMTYVTIGTENGTDNPQVRASVFGGGSNGHVEDDTHVNIYTGTIGIPLTMEEMVEYEPGVDIRPHVYRGNVYGGGRGVERATGSNNTYVLSNTAGVVFGNTNVTVDGGKIYHNVYGGGSLANVGTVQYNAVTGEVDTITTGGTATVIINGGKIGMEHGVDYTNPAGDNTIHSGLNNGQVFGSGRGEAGEQYADHAYVKFTNVIVNGGNIYGAVFGGGANGHVRQDTHVTINDGVIGVNDESTGMSLFSVYRGNVYGGGRGIDTDPNGTTHEVSKTAGQVRRDTYVDVNGGTIHHNVYGGGSLANVGKAVYDDQGNFVQIVYGGETHVTISGGSIGLMDDPNVPNGPGYNNGHVFGAGRGKPGVDEFGNDYTQLTFVKNTHVTIEGGLIRGSVFGSGDNGHVYKDTEVNVTGGQIGETAGPNQGNVFGGGRGLDTYRTEPKLSPTAAMVFGNTNVTVSGGIVKSNVYGGGNVATVGTFEFTLDGTGHVTGVTLADNTTGTTNVTVTGTATVGDGTAGYGHVFGACRGLLSEPLFSKVRNTNVTINSEAGSVVGNIYGGGELGEVWDSTNVVINSGTLHEVYGAGQGVANEANGRANIGDKTKVTVNNGIINNVYGGGQNGTVRYSGDMTNPPIASVVTVNNGTVKENVFGGGDQGTTEGRVIVNLNNGTIQGELFGGAKGTQGSVYVAGLKTVNMRGGTVYNHVYGGSRNANDGFALTDNTSSYTDGGKFNAFVNISGGMVRGSVYGAGFFGYMFGSSDINIGRDAILLANNKNIDRGTHTVNILRIIMNVFAGSNWGDYDPNVGFSSSTTTGRSNIYVDGNGYNTVTINGMEPGYMSIDGSLYGSGTSSDAGTMGRKIQVANYGEAVLGDQNMEPFGSRDIVPNVVLGASRYMQSIQRCDTVILDNSSIAFTGQGDISQNQNTVEYSLVYIQKGLYVRNGSNIVANMQIDETHAVYSQYRPDTHPTTGNPNGIYVKDPFTYWIGVGATDHNFYYNCESQTPTLLVDDPTDPTITNINTFRFNGGYSMYVRYKYKYEGGVISFADHGAFIFGELSGFFRMVTETGNETFAHARPKITSGTGNDNTADGGFLSYYNGGTNSANGHNTFTDNGAAYTCGQQFPYLNVLSSSGKGDRTDYRYWRIRESGSSNVVTTPVALFLYSHPNSTEQFHEIHATIELSTPDCSDSHYVLSNIDFGDNAHLVDAAIYDPDATGNTYYIVNSGSHDNHYHEVFINQAGNSYSWPAAGIDTLAYEQSKITGHPNTHFGLVISPSGCLAGYGNKSYIISENSKGYLVNNPDCKFDYPTNPNGQLPGVSLRITYNKELTMSAALAPVVIQFKRYCGSSTTPEDIINIPVYITTQTELGQNINMTSYVMYGDLHTGNAKESYRVKATLPPFDPYEAGLTGEDIPFYIYNQSFTNSTVNASDPEPDFLPYTTTAFAANDHNMAFTYQIALNSDNKSGWRESIPNSVPHDFDDGSTTPIQIGRADGRNPFSIDFTVYYNSCQEVITNEVSNMIYAKNDVIGTATFKVCYPITAAALHQTPPSTVENDINWKTFEILVNIFKRDNSLGFYVDGIRGDNNYTGEYANFGLRTLQGVIDHNWKPGDKVYVVRPISVPSNTLIWTSETVGSAMTLYRYPGEGIDPDHHATTDDRSPYVHNHLNNPGENTGYYQQSATEVIEDGAIFANVRGTGDLTLSGVILDGMNGDQSLYPWCPSNFVLSDHQNQEVPFIKVSDGGKVTLTRGSEVRYSNIKTTNPHGSAILVEDGGTLELSNNVTITHNTFPTGSTGQGAGIYMEPGGTIIVGGSVNVTGNKNAAGRENNVYLSDMSCEITIDQDNELSEDARIGVTKYDFYPSDPNELIALGLDPELYDLSPIASSVFPERIKEAFRNDNFQDDTERAYTHYYIRNTLYFGKTWAHFVTNHDEYNATTNPEGIEDGSFTVDGEGNVTVTSSKAFAYLISYINGLNDVDEKHPNAKVRIASDVDVHEHYWKPIIGFNGTFDGQWYHIDGITVKREGFRSIGMFDNVIGGGVVKNTYISSSDIQPWNPEDTGDLEDIEQFAGCIAGTVDNGGLVTECQVAGTVIASAESANRFTYIGGAVGHIKSGGVVHSVIGLANLTGFTMGGIVGRIETGGSLYNSYSYTKTLTSLSLGNDYSGGLAGYVKTGGYVENCYADLQCAKPNYFGWFAGKNEGTIRYCYAPEGESTYVFNSVGATLTGHGNYSPVIDDIKGLGYLYDDNKVTLAAGQTNDYHSNTITYANSRIDKWPGMVSALNHWVDDNPHNITGLSRWYRPNTTHINRDLPVLGMVDHTNMSATSPDVNTLRYDPSIDGTLTYCNSDDTHHSYVFFYGKETDVTKTPDDSVSVFINEDAVLMQRLSKAVETPDFQATTGITFDNSYGNAHDYYHGKLNYDWHLMSTPLHNASMGTTYNLGAIMGYGTAHNLTKMENGYFPNELKTMGVEGDVLWDFYCYDEPDYHWINFKRSTGNHWHMDTINGYYNPPIHYSGYNSLGAYLNEEEFVPGKGYMMAISQDSYLNNSGLLNKGDVKIAVTAMAPSNITGKPTYDKGSNLVGNPYQAYLDLEAVQADHSFITGFYFYSADSDTDANSNGLYVPYTAPASPNPAVPTQYVHPHQAFFIVVNPDSDTYDLTFTQDMAGTTADAGSFFRDGEKTRYPLVNLYVNDEAGNGDLCIVEFKRPELGGVKKIDNLRNADFKLYARYENEDYGLLFAPEDAQRIPVFFKTPHDGTYTLSWRTHHGTFSSMYLVDNITGEYYDMLANNQYQFEARATDYAARFYIVFSVTDVDEYDDDDINGNFAYNNGYGWVIEGQGQLELVDLLGHVLYADYLTGEQTIVHFDGIAAGMYMLRLVDGSKLKGVQKIVIRR